MGYGCLRVLVVEVRLVVRSFVEDVEERRMFFLRIIFLFYSFGFFLRDVGGFKIDRERSISHMGGYYK